MDIYDLCISFKSDESFEDAKIIKDHMDNVGISCYFDYYESKQIIDNGINVATEMVYGAYSKFKIVLLTDNYFIENSYPYKEWNAIINSLKPVNNPKDYFIVCSKTKKKFLNSDYFNYLYYSDPNKLAIEIEQHINNSYAAYKYSQYNLNQVSLEKEIKTISDKVFKNNKSILLKAPSGAGKTEFIKSIIRFNTYKNEESTPVIYYDFSNDALEQEMSIISILNSCKAKKLREEYLPANLLVDDTLLNFANIKGNKYYNIITDLQKEYIDNVYFADVLFAYLQWLCKKRNKVIIVFDNFQRCSDLKNELLLEKLFSLRNAQFIVAITTNNNFTIRNDIEHYINDIDMINLPALTEQEINQIIFSKLRNDTGNAIERIARLSKFYNYYNLKIIDVLCCFHNKYANCQECLKASDILANLSKSQLDILKLIYVAGGKIDTTIASNIFDCSNSDIIDLESLHCVEFKNNYIIFSHDTISVLVKEYSRDLKDFCQNVQLKIALHLYNNKEIDTLKLELMETYNNIIAVSQGSWHNALAIFADYIKLLSIKQAYHTIIEIKENLDTGSFNPFEYLGSETIGYLLEAYIKTAKIHKGLEVVNSLHTKNKNIVRLESRLMIQDYKYDNAIAKLSLELDIHFDSEIAMMLCNALAHKRYENRIKQIMQRFDSEDNKDDYYYIILRNTGHLFDLETAISNINNARKHFSEKQFEYATCCNNLGLQHVRKAFQSSDVNAINNAEKYFNEAKNIFETLNESELYQSTFNLALVEAYNNNFVQALKYINQALSILSNDLVFDRTKFNVTKVCLKLLNKEISVETCIEKFRKIIENLSFDFSGHDIDPWLIYQVNYNLMVIRNAMEGKETKQTAYDFSKIYFKDENGNNYAYKDNYGVYFSCVINDIKVELLFATSPHWRY